MSTNYSLLCNKTFFHSIFHPAPYWKKTGVKILKGVQKGYGKKKNNNNNIVYFEQKPDISSL